ncbi:odorant receptor 131-2-like [Ctenopharyngodon idella]|uniref:odorant receptor 131-2-like n=1 Tax=Ctenopharyngodon idella TaxID=7959 RepID=UPI00222F17C2|nr:odorant receptor 131-2-like [Ctenopharyngodon idella]
MNSTIKVDEFYDMFIKNFISVVLSLIINYINGTFVIVFFKNIIFCSDPRYILYIHLVINDMIMLSVSVGLQVTKYVLRTFSVSVCCVVLLFLSTVTKNSPLNLACMSIERYIAICKPLHHSQICTVRRTYLLICFIWTAAAAPALSDIFIALSNRPPSFFSTATSCHMLFIYNTWQHTVKDTVVNVVYLSFEWTTLIVTYLKVFSAANAASADQVSARKARNTILLHGVQLLLCMMSYITPFMSTALVDLFPQSRSNILFILFLLSNVLPRLLSPLIYGLRDKQFVERVKVYFCYKQVRTQIIPVK